MTASLVFPAGLTPESFLAEYWQKRPLLLPQALADFVNPISPDDVAALACEADVESRLILERASDRKPSKPWQLHHGPFDPEIFADLPESHWSLLVQEVDHYVPSLALLLDCFRFIPNWRIDDVMVSFAPRDGSVGPHADQYDVFLLQGLGQKRWEISQQPISSQTLISDSDLEIVADFEAQQSWVLGPGDVLYLPPGVIHHGRALDDNLTYSIGFRAPSERDLFLSFGDYLAEHRLSDARYRDPDLKRQDHPGEIRAEMLSEVRQIVTDNPVSDDDIARWFGQFVTEAKGHHTVTAHQNPLDEEAFVARFERGEALLRNESSRFACTILSQEILLFVAGEAIALNHDSSHAVHALCDDRIHVYSKWRDWLRVPANLALIVRLYREGQLYFESDRG